MHRRWVHRSPGHFGGDIAARGKEEEGEMIYGKRLIVLELLSPHARGRQCKGWRRIFAVDVDISAMASRSTRF